MAATAQKANGGSAQLHEAGAPPFVAGHALGAGSPIGLDAVLQETAQRRLNMLPRDMGELFDLAERVARSGWAPKSYRVQPDNDNSPFDIDKIYVAMMHGNEAGLTPLASLQSIAVINGMPSIWGDGALALVRASGLLDDFEETQEWDGADPISATCRLKRKGQPTQVIQTFTRANAQKAGLWTKQGPWTKYPQRMLQMRARAWALRDTFADVLKGLYIAEEAMDIETVIAHTPPAAAKQATATAPAAPVTPATVADVLKKVEVEKERYPLYDQHSDQLCEYTNPADWVSGLVEIAAKSGDGRAFALENNHAIAEQIAEKHADCVDNIAALYKETESPATGSQTAVVADAHKVAAEIDFGSPAGAATGESARVDRPAATDGAPPATVAEGTAPATTPRQEPPRFTLSDAPTWLTFRSKMEAAIRDAPNAQYVTDLMATNKERITAGPLNQQTTIRDLAAKRWRELGGKQ